MRHLALLAALPLLVSCISVARIADTVDPAWSEGEMWVWLQGLTPRLECPCRDSGGGAALVCRSYVGSWGRRYIAVHDALTMELLRVIRLEEWRAGVRQVLVWRRPAGEWVAEGSVVL